MEGTKKEADPREGNSTRRMLIYFVALCTAGLPRGRQRTGRGSVRGDMQAAYLASVQRFPAPSHPSPPLPATKLMQIATVINSDNDRVSIETHHRMYKLRGREAVTDAKPGSFIPGEMIF